MRKQVYALIQHSEPYSEPYKGNNELTSSCFRVIKIFDGLSDALTAMDKTNNPEWFMVMGVWGNETYLKQCIHN